MSEKRIGEMDDAGFMQLMEAFVDRPSGPDDEIPAELVFAMLDRAELTPGLLALHSRLVGDRLVLSTSPGARVPESVRDIEIRLPNVRVVVSLETSIGHASLGG
ncbi:MAG: hypothetical protein ISS49_16255 [Anaerolineae bacterium]|nr:hypothetical protein [Anaerolineae bacterium]